MKFAVASMLAILASRWCPRTSGFTVLQQDRRVSGTRMALEAIRVNLDTISDVGYEATVEKPLCVVFGENRPPFNGLRIDSIAEGSNGEQAGFKVGDQLLAVNGQSVIGEDFDTAMDALRSAESPVELRLYKGLVSTLFSIVMNRRSDDDDDFEEETTEEVIFDESYESPVVMTFDDENDNDKISVSAVAGEAVKNLGQMFGKSFSSMFSQETIQREEKDGK
jgi:PDZ domain